MNQHTQDRVHPPVRVTVQDLFDAAGAVNHAVNSLRSNLNLVYGENIEGLRPEDQDDKAAGNPGRLVLLREWRSAMTAASWLRGLDVSAGISDEDRAVLAGFRL